MTNNQIKIFDEKGNVGIAVYKARRKEETDWKLLYIWADYKSVTRMDYKSGELMPKGYYMYLYLGTKIVNMCMYDCNGPLGQIFLGETKKNTKDNFEKHASLVTYWGEDVLKELFDDIEVDLENGLNVSFYHRHWGKVFPSRFIQEDFPVYVYKPFWRREKWDRLPEDNEFLI